MRGLPSQPHVARDPAPAIIDAAPAAAFTPGPWSTSYDGVWAKSPWNATVRIATITYPSPWNGIDGNANARLIAVAPELFEALEWLVASVTASAADERYPGDREERISLACGAARAAIAKALTGQSEAMQHGNSGMDTK